MSGYSNGLQVTYNFVARVMTAAGDMQVLSSPRPGLTGRLTSISAVVTITAGGAGLPIFQVGVDAGDIDAYGSIALPAAAAADTIHNTLIRGVVDRIPADTLVNISQIGVATTTGTANVTVTIEWS